MKYRVEVRRIAFARTTVEVEAESVDQAIGQAEDLAMKKALEEEFSTYETEYELGQPVATESRKPLEA